MSLHKILTDIWKLELHAKSLVDLITLKVPVITKMEFLVVLALAGVASGYIVINNLLCHCSSLAVGVQHYYKFWYKWCVVLWFNLRLWWAGFSLLSHFCARSPWPCVAGTCPDMTQILLCLKHGLIFVIKHCRTTATIPRISLKALQTL